MNKLEVKRLVESNKMLNEFVNSANGQLDVPVNGVPIRIFKESVGVSYYYRFPYDEKYNYSDVADFMHWAVPVISELVEKRRMEKLMKSDF